MFLENITHLKTFASQHFSQVLITNVFHLKDVMANVLGTTTYPQGATTCFVDSSPTLEWLCTKESMDYCTRVIVT